MDYILKKDYSLKSSNSKCTHQGTFQLFQTTLQILMSCLRQMFRMTLGLNPDISLGINETD